MILYATEGEARLAFFSVTGDTDEAEYVLQMAKNRLWFRDDVKLAGAPARVIVRRWEQFVPLVNSEPIVLASVDWALAARGGKLGEDEFRRVFKFRTRADRSIMQARWSDIAPLCDKEVLVDLAQLTEGFDYVSVCNLAATRVLFGHEWWQRWHGWHAFDHGLSWFTTLAKQVNDWVKTEPVDDPNWIRYVECGVLSGYRQLPFPGFDVFAQAEDLAHGGQGYRPKTIESFAETAARVLSVAPGLIGYLSFPDYVASTRWLTSGSSTMGRLEFTTPDGKTHSVRARKNFVPDVIDLTTLTDLATQSAEHKNYVIVKSELGKVRLAVSSDLLSYLSQSWIVYLTGHGYLDYRGNTLEEQPNAEANRQLRILSLLRTRAALPFDYIAFDHQPTTDELKIICRSLVNTARSNVPPADSAEFERLADNFTSAFDHSTLTLKWDGKEYSWLVTGGLMSGLRITSVVGNAWNTVMTERAIDLAVQLGVFTNREEVDFYLRGDDSCIITQVDSQAMVLAVCYTVVGAIGAPGKYGIHRGQVEFLRQWYQQRVMGYPVRAIPGLFQRKPWSSEPWQPAQVLRRQFEVCGVLSRRGVEIESIWRRLRDVWCWKHRLPSCAVGVPIALGGLGIEPWDGRFLLSARIPAVPPVLAKLHMLPWRSAKLRAFSTLWGIPIDDASLALVAEEQLRGVLATDDVPDFTRQIQADWHSLIRATRIRAVRATPPSRPTTRITVALPAQEDALRDAHAWISQHTSSYGLYSRFAPIVEAATPILARSSLGLLAWIEHAKPDLWSACKRWRGTVSSALDWYLGRMSFSPGWLHPAVRGLFTSLVIAHLSVSAVRNARLSLAQVALLHNSIAFSIFASPLYQLLYLC